MFVKAKKILASELMYAKNMDEDECHEWLEEVLATKAAAPKKRATKKAVATA
jgi:RNA polymerase-interacting CarD/CdnL/TRCF family regulator